MPKKSSSKKPAPRPGNPVMKDNGPSSTPKKPGNDNDEMFSTKKRKKTEQEKAGKQVEDESAKLTKLKKRKNKRIEPKEKKYLDPPTQPRKKIGDGFFAYTSEELGLWKSDAGGTEENGETVYMRWNQEVDKCFLDTCIQEVTKKGRLGGSLFPESWTTIMEVLKENHNFVVSQRQMKNRYDYLKRKYQAGLTLKTSHVYDHRTNTINMTDSEWQEYIKTHPKAKEANSLKHAPLLYPELCTTLFEGADEHEGSSNLSNSKDQDLGMEKNGEAALMRWNPEVDKCFLDTCIQEVTKRGRQGGSLCMASWTTIMEVLKENHNFVVSQRQMKNRYDYLKRKYQAWLILKTSHVIDHRTNKINMTNSEWREYIKTHPKAKSLKLAPLLYPELCATLFELNNEDIEVDEHEENSDPSNSKEQDLGIEENGRTILTRWNPEVDKCFLETCIQEVTNRGRRGGSLCMESWTTIMEVLKENHNFAVSQRQMKNRYDYLKRKYQAWLTLKTIKVNVTNSEWQQYIKTHSSAKDVKALKHAPLLYPELCTTLFEDSIITGVDALGPNYRYQDLDDNSSNSRNVEQLENEDLEVDEHEGNSNPSSSKDQDLVITSSPSNSRNVEQLQVVEHAGNSNPFGIGTHSKAYVPPSKGDKPENKTNCQPSTSETKLQEAVSYALSLLLKNQCGPSVTDCIAKLDEVGWDKEDDLYVSAIVIFGNSAGHREAWMNLPKDNAGLLTSWIKKVGQIMGLTF